MWKAIGPRNPSNVFSLLDNLSTKVTHPWKNTLDIIINPIPEKRTQLLHPRRSNWKLLLDPTTGTGQTRYISVN